MTCNCCYNINSKKVAECKYTGLNMKSYRLYKQGGKGPQPNFIIEDLMVTNQRLMLCLSLVPQLS